MNWCSTTSPPAPRGAAWTSDWVRRVSETIDIPFCVAGGIRSVESAGPEVLSQGADKISINTPALENPGLINDMVQGIRQPVRGDRGRFHRRR